MIAARSPSSYLREVPLKSTCDVESRERGSVPQNYRSCSISERASLLRGEPRPFSCLDCAICRGFLGSTPIRQKCLLYSMLKQNAECIAVHRKTRHACLCARKVYIVSVGCTNSDRSKPSGCVCLDPFTNYSRALTQTETARFIWTRKEVGFGEANSTKGGIDGLESWSVCLLGRSRLSCCCCCSILYSVRGSSVCVSVRSVRSSVDLTSSDPRDNTISSKWRRRSLLVSLRRSLAGPRAAA